MLSSLHKKYWIFGANLLVRKFMNKCVPCRKKHTCAREQKMADLPNDSLTPDLPPFSHIGVDYVGPIDMRRGRGRLKGYGVIFTLGSLYP